MIRWLMPWYCRNCPMRLQASLDMTRYVIASTVALIGAALAFVAVNVYLFVKIGEYVQFGR